jgi:hypothetical protein
LLRLAQLSRPSASLVDGGKLSMLMLFDPQEVTTVTKGNLEKLLRTLQDVESKCGKMRASASAKSDNDFEQAARDLHTWAAEKGNELRAKYET